MRGILLVAWLLPVFAVCGQTLHWDKHPNYTLSFAIDGVPCDDRGNPTGGATISIPAGTELTVSRAKDEDLVVYLWLFQSSADRYKYNAIDSRRLQETRRYFRVRANDLAEYGEKRYITGSAQFTVGAVVLPLKLRFNAIDFTKDFTFAPVAGVKIRLSHFAENYLNIVGGVGISAITLDSSNTEGRFRRNSERPAFSPIGGVVLEFRGINTGIYTGVDLTGDEAETGWRYDGKPWIALGLGFSILSAGSAVKHTSRKPLVQK